MRKASLKNVTIIELMVAINRRYSDIPALQIKRDGKFFSISYRELGKRSSDTAYNLKVLGVEAGDRVAILSESKPEWGIAFFGIVSCAGITVPMDIKLSEAEMEFILNDSQAKCIFVSVKFAETILKLKPKLPQLKHVICLDNAPNESVLLLKDFAVPENGVAHREIQPDDVGLIVYTSGTTGVAKGVELTYKNLLFEIMSLHDLITFSPEDRFLSVLPLNHMLEITGGFLGPLYAGATVTYCESLKPTNMTALMKETGTTVMICVPLVFKMFHNGIFKKLEELPNLQRVLFNALFKLSGLLIKFNLRLGKNLFASVHKEFGGHIRCFVSGGAPLDPKIETDFDALGFRILQGYGLTETSPVITVNSLESSKPGSVGKPLPGLEVKILKNSESSAKDGEIITKGPHVMKGYYKNPEKTAEVLRQDWFYTGDIGYFDDEGFLFISGRIKNLIVLGAGKKVFPEEVEEVMSKSRLIKELCVLGRVAQKGLRKGCEEVYAVVVPNLDNFSKEDSQNNDLVKKKIAEELLRLGENLSEYKRIQEFEIWPDELPKTSTRKVKRKVLLELIAQKETESDLAQKQQFIESAIAEEDSLSISLRRIIADLTKAPFGNIRLESNLYNDLAIDSLMKVEILSAIQKQEQVDIPDRLAYEINTFADLVKFTRQYKQGRSGDEIGLRREVNDFIRKNARAKLMHNLSYFVFKGLFKTYFKGKVRGLENLPAKGSFIIAANHVSLLDFPLLLASLPFSKTKDVFAPAAKDFFYAKKCRRAIVEMLFNTFPFERMGDFMKGLKICESLINDGKSIIIFPEGTRVMQDELQQFKPGLGSLAYNLKVPIIPVYIDGALEALPKGKVFPLPRQISVHFGKPVIVEEVDFTNMPTNYEKYAYLSLLAFNKVKELKEAR